MRIRRVAPHLGTILVVAVLIVTQQAWAAPLANRVATTAGTSKTTIAYQGYLTDSADNPVNAQLEIVFKLYAVESGGSALWSETQPAVSVANGLFSVLLGSVTPLPASLIANNPDLWLGVTVGSDTEMTPRDKLASAPYAMMADVPDGSITQYKLANDAVTSAKIVDGAVSMADVNFTYAASTAKGGPATDLTCTSCVSGGEISDGSVNSAKIIDGSVNAADVGFSWAGGTSAGGAATDVACTACVSGGEIADASVNSAKIADNSVGSGDVGFNFAGATGKGGAAIDLGCTGCVSDSDVAGSSISQSKLVGVRLWVGSTQIPVDGNGMGCTTINLPAGRFTNTPDIFVIRQSIGSWEDNADYAKSRFIETTRSTASATICVDDDRISNGSVGVAVLAVQTD